MKLSRSTLDELVVSLGLEGMPPIVRTILVTALAGLSPGAKLEVAAVLLETLVTPPEQRNQKPNQQSPDTDDSSRP